MTTIKDLKKQLQSMNAARQKIEDNISELKNRLSTTKEEMKQAAAAGNMDEYKRLYHCAEDIRIDLESSMQYWENAASKELLLPEETVAPVMQRISKEYNEKQSSDIAQYYMLREDLFKLFCSIVRRRNDLNKDRAECIRLVEGEEGVKAIDKGVVPGWSITPFPVTIEYDNEFSKDLEAAGTSAAAVDWILTEYHANMELNL